MLFTLLTHHYCAHYTTIAYHYPLYQVSVVNFAITFTGLEDQLLGVVVVEEMPEMEERKNSLVAGGARMRRELADIENLFLLSNSTGNILDDHELIETLASSKKTSTEIAAKVAEASATEAEIDATRELYRPVAYRGAILYFCIRDLGVVDPMYQYSLQWFTGLFVTATRRGERAPLLSDRLRDLSEGFTYYVYTSVCRSLFEKDKLLFSFLMAIRVLQGSGGVDPAEWRFLITGEALPTTSSSTTTAAASASSEGSTTTAPAAPTLAAAAVAAAEAEAAAFLAAAPNPAPEWIDGRMWKEVKALSSLPAFRGLARDFEGPLRGEFKAMYDHAEPQLLQLPGGWGREGKLDALQKLCLLRCVRADKVSVCVLVVQWTC
jgi:dynein heavy chain, axonemal